ncbi:MAG: 16S rRNA (guanine(527)-N(7))-methyltransferase RsmG [Firmicutes bacterium]|nr:16S rRNA (guanine(527)-N(7))-methyltransferase RsmG [Bacillota bacterium]
MTKAFFFPEVGLPVNLEAKSHQLFSRYAQLLLQRNQEMNLTRITDLEEIAVKHFWDSLALLKKMPTLAGAVLDVGSGAGLPGIPLKIAVPEIKLTLVDSLQKRVSFLQEVVTLLALKDVNVIHARAEDLAKEVNIREQFPLVVSRAVARLNVLLELCLPFVQVGGCFVAYKGPESEQEVEEAKLALQELGGEIAETWSYQLPGGMGERALIFVKKVKPTPAKYPRRAGIPAKRPIK